MAAPYVYQALNEKEDFNQARSDADFALKLKQLQSNQVDEQNQKNQQALGVFSQYMQSAQEEMKNLLPQDAARVNAKYQSLIQPILTNLKTSGVDPDRYLMTGGAAELPATFSQLANSDELKQGMLNKQNSVAYLSDIASGKIPRNPQQDQIIADYQAGKRKDIPYSGSIAPLKADITEFTKIPRPAGEGANVSEPYLKQWIKYKGGYNDSDAQRIYDTQYKGVQIPWGAPKLQQYDFRKTKAYSDLLYGTGGVKDATYSQIPKAAYDLATTPSGKIKRSDFLNGLVYTSTDDNGQPKDRIIANLQTTPNGGYKITYQDGKREYTDKKLWDIISAATIKSSGANPNAAIKTLDGMAKTANRLGYAKKIGAPIMTKEQSGTAVTDDYQNVIEVTDAEGKPATIGLKDGEWYNTETGEKIGQ